MIPLHPRSDQSSVVSYRLSRQRVVDAVSKGTKSQVEVCDAQPELRRVAHSCSTPLAETCPICEEEDLVAVTFAFGAGLPKAGRVVANLNEMQQLKRRGRPYRCYTVEVCRRCWWNHLMESFSING